LISPWLERGYRKWGIDGFWFIFDRIHDALQAKDQEKRDAQYEVRLERIPPLAGLITGMSWIKYVHP
jgi:hypothetical protein